jgi:DNA mismatch repair ATPase MutS
VTGAYDLALAAKIAGTDEAVITNDFRFDGNERVLVISGPNQGGKTTFARSVGQLHYLAALGLPVPAGEATLLHVDDVFTHFDREEAIAEEQGRLAADLLRTRDILDRAGSTSLVILNELFQSTQAGDAADLTARVLAALRQRDVLTVCVTFVDEVGTGDEAIVSMVSTRDAEASASADFRVVRRAPAGRAQADTLAARHGLTPRALARRLGE